MLEGRTVAVMLLEWPVMAAVSMARTHRFQQPYPLIEAAPWGLVQGQIVWALTVLSGFVLWELVGRLRCDAA